MGRIGDPDAGPFFFESLRTGYQLPKENNMGLDCSHDAWHGAYSAFMRWRTELAKVAGLPPLGLMEGFFSPNNHNGAVFLDHNASELSKNSLQGLHEQLPIKWECLKPSALHELLNHSDCDGEIAADRCGPIADELEKLIPLLPDGEAGGHIGHWRQKTEQFVKGLREAAAAGEPLDFH